MSVLDPTIFDVITCAPDRDGRIPIGQLVEEEVHTFPSRDVLNLGAPMNRPAKSDARGELLEAKNVPRETTVMFKRDPKLLATCSLEVLRQNL